MTVAMMCKLLLLSLMLLRHSVRTMFDSSYMILTKNHAVYTHCLHLSRLTMLIYCCQLLPRLLICLWYLVSFLRNGSTCALINPLLKKVGLDLLFPNYRPISNLKYISKLTEKAVFNQIHAYMTTNAIYPELQSSYHRFHSTEKALLKVTNDILMKMNSQEVTLLVMLDLSASFDTVNHGIVISRLHEEVGVSGLALEWFRSYLQNRTQRVAVDGTFSERFVLNHGVPQGSCLGPLLFIIYSSKLFKLKVIRDQLPEAHCYADRTIHNY